MIIVKDAKNTLNKIQLSFKIFKTTTTTTGNETYFFNMRKDTYLKAPTSNLLNWEILGMRENCQTSLLFLTLFYKF